jgi:DNA-binding beta-propeller fold protein YncE
MRNPTIVLACGVLLSLPLPHSHGAAPESLYVINGKKPSVSIVDAETWTITASIPLADSVGGAELDATGRFLYTVNHGVYEGMNSRLEDEPSTLSVIDLAEGRVVKTIPLPWRVRSLVFSEDGRYLISSTRGRLRSSGRVIVSGTGFLPTDGRDTAGPSHEHGGYLSVIDTRTNTVRTTVPTGLYTKQVLWTRDVSRIFVLTAGSLARGQGWLKAMDRDPLLASSGLVGEDERLLVLKPDSTTPLADIPFDRTASSMLLSKDEKWLYLLQPGTPSEAYLKPDGEDFVVDMRPDATQQQKTERFAGRLLVIDVGAGKIAATYEVGTAPRGLNRDSGTDTVLLLSQARPEDLSGRLYRFRGSEMLPPLTAGLDPRFPVRCPGESGVRIVSTEDIRLLEDAGQRMGEPLILNRILKKGERFEKATVSYLGDVPIAPIYLPKRNTLALLTLQARVGIVDLNKSTSAQIFVLRDATRSFLDAFPPGAVGWQFMLGVSSITLPSGRSMGLMKAAQIGYVSQGNDVGPSRVATRPDGAFLYLFDGPLGSVSILDVQSRSTVGWVHFGTGCVGIMRPPGDKYIFGVHRGSVTLIDTATNKERLRHRIPGETIRQAFTRKEGGQLVVLTDNLLRVVDVESGRVLGTVAGLHEPGLVLEPQRSSPR